MKKVLSIVFVLMMVVSLAACMPVTPGETSGEAAAEEATGVMGFLSGPYGSIVMLVGIVAIFYFLMIRPQKNKEKKTKEMLNNIEVGDGVTTIGGIVGRVVSIKDDTLLVETGTDRTKMRFQKWAIQEVEKLSLED